MDALNAPTVEFIKVCSNIAYLKTIIQFIFMAYQAKTSFDSAPLDPPVRDVPSPSPDNPFEIGLVMAGAVSAGAYTAGVCDFVIQALDDWYAAFPSNSPPHQVRLKVASGASAGGINAAIMAASLPFAFPSVRLPDHDNVKSNGNPFFVYVRK